MPYFKYKPINYYTPFFSCLIFSFMALNVYGDEAFWENLASF